MQKNSANNSFLRFWAAIIGYLGLQNLHVFGEIFRGAILEIIFRQKQFLRAPYFLIF